MRGALDIVVVAHRRRQPIITESLRRTDYKTWYGVDYPKPAIEDSPRAKVLGLPTGAGPYRCFRAHQDACKLARPDAATLIFEDDARPVNHLWPKIAHHALPMLERYEVVSLHGRDQANVVKTEVCNGLRFNVLGKVDKGGIPMVWQLGAMAYLVSPQTAAKIQALAWDGYPIDLVICNDFSFCVLADSPFRHDRRHGSLVETV